MQKNVTTADIKEMLIETFELEMEMAELTDDMGIIGHGIGLDSVDALEIIVQVDKRFGVKIKDADIQKEDFMDIAALTNFVNRVANRPAEEVDAPAASAAKAETTQPTA